MKFLVYELNLTALQKRVAALNKQLLKAGQQEIIVRQTGHVEEENDNGRCIRRIEIEAEGTEPVYNGWHFVGTIVHTDDGNVVRLIPGKIIGEANADRFRTEAPRCDHCKTNRRRKDTYVLKHIDGNMIQVGSSCMTDFLQHDGKHFCRATELICAAYDVVESATKRGWLGGGAYEPWRISKEMYLAYVAQVVAVDGKYVTSKVAKERETMPTSRHAYNVMFPMSGHQDDVEWLRRYEPTAEAFAYAEAACAFVVSNLAPVLNVTEGDDDAIKVNMLQALTGSAPTLTDFEHNLLVCARAESIEPRLCGTAAFIIEDHRRHLAVTTGATKTVSQHVGVVGKRLRGLKLEVVGCTQNDMGNSIYPSTFIRFKDAAGNAFIWKASGHVDYARGAVLTVTGTVKEHGDFKGVLQTKLSRCVVAEEAMKPFVELIA